MRNFSLVVFDLDGVLVDTASAHERAYVELWQKLGISVPPYGPIAGRKTSDVIAEMTAHLRPDATQLAEWLRFKQQRAREIIETEDIVFSDSADTMRALAQRGYRMALGTGASRGNATISLRRLGCADLLFPIVAAEDVAVGKPAPDVYLRVLAEARVAPEDAVVIEDSVSGLAAALAAGMWAAVVRSGVSTTHPRFLGSFGDLRALLPLFGTNAA